MTKIQVLLFNCLIIFYFFPSLCKDDMQIVYIKGVQCNSSEKYIHQNYSCFPKSYNRHLSTVNVIAKSKIPLNNIFVRIFIISKKWTWYSLKKIFEGRSSFDLQVRSNLSRGDAHS